MELALLGDIALNGLFVEDSENNRKRFAQVEAKLKNIDFVLANLETLIKSENINQFKVNKKGIIMFTTKEVLSETLKLLNISHVSLANNHSLDFSNEGLDATIKVLDKLGISYSGVDTPYKIIEFNQIKIAFLSSVCLSTNPHFPIGNSRINIYFYQQNIEKIKYIKENNLADKIIVSIHWGVDYSHYPTEKQILEARSMIDVGADIIWGHHPHVMQPYEQYKNGLIFYSLGQLCFGDYVNDIGNLTAMRARTKKCFIPLIQINYNTFSSILSFLELKGNYLINIKLNLNFWNNNKWFLYHLSNRIWLVGLFIRIYERIAVKYFHLIFGNYRGIFSKCLYNEIYSKVILRILNGKVVYSK